MGSNAFQFQAVEALLDADVANFRELGEAEAAALPERLCARFADATDCSDVSGLARALAARARPKVELLEWVERNSSARRTYDARGPVWTFEFSARTRAFRVLLEALEVWPPKATRRVLPREAVRPR